MSPFEIEVRSEICEQCPLKCPTFTEGNIKPTDPCATCPPDRKTLLPVHSECGSPQAVTHTIADSAKGTKTKHQGRALRPGSVLKWAIAKLTGELPHNCACNSRANQMDAWGWLECWRQRKTIYGWLQEEGQKRGHEINEASARALLSAAWKAIRLTRGKE